MSSIPPDARSADRGAALPSAPPTPSQPSPATPPTSSRAASASAPVPVPATSGGFRTSLRGRVALVAGATRGAGRGIARMLGAAGATVYCTGRSTRGALASGAHRPETIEETAALVGAAGGTGIPLRVDHTVESEVVTLVERIRREQGKLDVLVNDIWGGDARTEWGAPFWSLSLEQGRAMLDAAVWSHVVTSRHAAPLMVERRAGLIVEITDGDGLYYRQNLFYDLAKVAAIRLAYGMAEELAPHGVTALALTPGFLRSEQMLDHFGVTEATWRDATSIDPNFIASETPSYVGRAVVALAADPQVARKAGGVYSSWGLAEEYGFSDVDGTRPNWGRHVAEHVRELPGGPPRTAVRWKLEQAND